MQLWTSNLVAAPSGSNTAERLPAVDIGKKCLLNKQRKLCQLESRISVRTRIRGTGPSPRSTTRDRGVPVPFEPLATSSSVMGRLPGSSWTKGSPNRRRVVANGVETRHALKAESSVQLEECFLDHIAKVEDASEERIV
jgi:hypothetical protein